MLCGALAVGGLWLGSVWLDTPAQAPTGDAAVACAILEGLPAASATSTGARLYAASELSATAAGDDERWTRLAESTRRAYLSSEDRNNAAVDEHVEAAVGECRR
ncbi:hypothetical protein SAMN05443668_10985 [Cryptosporangium aurantiacum]|uniref:Uncharacterized protein n=1 Tax=Cryptosporangium aurantiacum TaxID=134849 RepID=A0A1M7RA85_9ACTN|nr:hypothetical protein SAMN05443668_10985 [Cryptosporangium aurantiacum]